MAAIPPRPLLSVEHLTLRFGARTVVDDVSFHINRGETVALVGESGSGKSLSALSCLRLTPASAHVTGHARFDGIDLLAAPDTTVQAVRGKRIGMIFQEPLTALNPLHRVERQIAEAIQTHDPLRSRQDVNARVEELMTLVELKKDQSRLLQSYPHELSGGQRQRVMIAMALANSPDLLIADEPTTALDVTVQAQILKLLRRLQKKTGMAMLFISHDLHIVRHMAQRLYVMQQGKIVEHGASAALFRRPRHPYSRQLLGAHLHGTPRAVKTSSPVLLQTDHLNVWFPVRRGVFLKTVGHVKAVQNVSFSLRQGETLGIVGESGSGKTTLGHGLLRLVPSTGDIRFETVDVHALSARDLRARRADMQVVFQDPFSALSPRLTVEQIVREGLDIHRPHLSDTQKYALIGEALKEVGLDNTARTRYPHEFSGGQRQRICIARALVLRPKLLVLDEPTSALDMTVQVQIIDLLRRLQQKYTMSYIFISHDLRVIRALSHRILVMRHGKVVEQGTARAVFGSPKTSYAKHLLRAALEFKSDSV